MLRPTLVIAVFSFVLVGLYAAGCASSSAPSGAPVVTGDAPAVLLVMTNHGEMGDTGEATGVWLDEASHPWAVFTEAGFRVVLASPEGGDVPVDPRSLQDIDADGAAFIERFARSGGRRVPATVALGEVEPSEFDAVFFAGGHGTMWDFPGSPSVRSVAESIYRDGGVVAAVCHGPAALVSLRNPDGTPVVRGKRVATFTDSEEDAVGLTEAVPFLLESRLRELGARVQVAPDFEENVVVDRRLVTGQNPASAEGTARATVREVRAIRRRR